MGLKYQRVLLKLSGEALAGEKKFGLDFDTIQPICRAIKEAVTLGAEIGIVVGGGNFWRGRSSGSMERSRADHIGMLATMMNALAVADALEDEGVPVRVQSALAMPQVADVFVRDKAVEYLKQKTVVIFGCGTGCPYFSTDTTAALRGAEIGADIILKATMVDGVYDKDPHRFADAVRYDTLTFTEVLEQNLGVIDLTAASMCKDNGLKLMVFDLGKPENIVKVLKGEPVGTLVTNESMKK